MYYISVSVISVRIPPEFREVAYFSRTLIPVGTIIPITLGNRNEYGIVTICTDIAVLKSSLKQTIYTLKPISVSALQNQITLPPDIFAILYEIHKTSLQSLGSLIAYYLPDYLNISESQAISTETIPVPVTFYETDQYIPSHISEKIQHDTDIIIVGFNHGIITVLQHDSAISEMMQHARVLIIHHSEFLKTLLSLKDPAHIIIPYAESSLFTQSITAPYVNHMDMLLCAVQHCSQKIVGIDFLYHTLTLQTHQHIADYFPDYVYEKSTANKSNLHWEILEKTNRFLDTSFTGDTARSLAQTMRENKTAIIMTHRTGVSSSIICNNCQFIAQCETCNKPLTLQQKTKTGERVFVCVTCRNKSRVIDMCPVCDGLLTPLGYTTEKIKNDITELVNHVNLPSPIILIADNQHIRTTKKLTSWITNIKKHHHEQPLIIITTPHFIHYVPVPSIDLGIVISIEGLCAYPSYDQDDHAYTSIRGLCTRTQNSIIQSKSTSHYLKPYIENTETKPWRDEQLHLSETYHYPPAVICLELIINKPSVLALSEKHILTELLSEHADWITIRSTGLRVIRTYKKTNHQYTITVYYDLSLHDRFFTEIYPLISNVRIRRLS